MQAIRDTIRKHTGVEPPPLPPRPRIKSYGELTLTQQGTLLSQLGNLVAGPGIYSDTPKPMEEYNQWSAPTSTPNVVVDQKKHSRFSLSQAIALVCIDPLIHQ